MAAYYMGVDPGPSTGIALLNIDFDLGYNWEVFQCYGTSAMWLLESIYRDYCPRAVAVEAFIPSNRAGTTGKDAQLTRTIADYAVSKAYDIQRNPHAFVITRRAVDVKKWASDKRMKLSGFPTGEKFKDARDAGRHALYCAVWDGKERDPLA